MSKNRDNRGKPIGMETNVPRVMHQEPDVMAEDPAMKTPATPETVNREEKNEAKKEEKPKPIIDWKGPADLHECPKCGARVLQDRMTKACVVLTTRQLAREGDLLIQDREMLCLRCQMLFIAREKKIN